MVGFRDVLLAIAHHNKSFPKKSFLLNRVAGESKRDANIDSEHFDRHLEIYLKILSLFKSF